MTVILFYWSWRGWQWFGPCEFVEHARYVIREHHDSGFVDRFIIVRGSVVLAVVDPSF